MLVGKVQNVENRVLILSLEDKTDFKRVVLLQTLIMFWAQILGLGPILPRLWKNRELEEGINHENREALRTIR